METMIEIRVDPEYGPCLIFCSHLHTNGVGWSGEFPTLTLLLTPAQITQAIQLTLHEWVNWTVPRHFRPLDEIMKEVRFQKGRHSDDTAVVSFDLDENCWKRHIDGLTYVQVPLGVFLYVLVPHLAAERWITLAQMPLPMRDPFKETWQSVLHAIKSQRKGRQVVSPEIKLEVVPQKRRRNANKVVLPFRRKTTG